MRRAISNKLTYANVMATAAMFIALGGGAYALSNNSVKSRHIANGQVKQADVKDESLKGKDVEDKSLAVEDIDSFSFDWRDLPVGGAAGALIRDVGTGGDTLYGGIYGRTTAGTDPEDFYMQLPLGVRVDSLRVDASAPVSAGETRTVSVVALNSNTGQPSLIALTCTIQIVPVCEDFTPLEQYNGPFVIRIESTGAGLDATDDLYVGFTVKAPIDEEE